MRGVKFPAEFSILPIKEKITNYARSSSNSSSSSNSQSNKFLLLHQFFLVFVVDCRLSFWSNLPLTTTHKNTSDITLQVYQTHWNLIKADTTRHWWGNTSNQTCLSVDSFTLLKWFSFSCFPHKKTEDRVLAIRRTTSQQGTSSSIRKTLCGKPKTATLGPTYPSLVCCFGTSTLEKSIVLVIYRTLRVSRSS